MTTPQKENQEDALTVMECIDKYAPLERLLQKLEPLDHQSLLEKAQWRKMNNPHISLLYLVKHSQIFNLSATRPLPEMLKKHVTYGDIDYDHQNEPDILIPLLEKALEVCLSDQSKPHLSHISTLVNTVLSKTPSTKWSDDLVRLISNTAQAFPALLRNMGQANVNRFQKRLKGFSHHDSPEVASLAQKAQDAHTQKTKKMKDEKEKRVFTEEVVGCIVGGRKVVPQHLERFDLFTQEEKQDFITDLLDTHDWFNRLQKTNKVLGERLDGIYLPYEKRIFYFLTNSPEKRVDVFYKILLPCQKRELRLHLAMNSQPPTFNETEKMLNALLDQEKVKAQDFATFIPIYFTNNVLTHLKNKKAIQKTAKKAAELEQKGLASSSLLGLIEGLCEINDVPSPLGASPKTYPKVAMGSSNVYDPYYFGRRKVFKPYNDWVGKKKLNQKIKKSLKSVKKLEETSPKPKRKM